MGCRIGMATNVADRVDELKDDGTVPQHATYRTLVSGLTYEEANAEEQERREKCGSHCEGACRRRYVAGSVWSVYRIDW